MKTRHDPPACERRSRAQGVNTDERNGMKRKSNGSLSGAQLKALEALLAGETERDAAKAAEVDPEVLGRWRREDYAFRAAYNRGRGELRDAMEARLLRVAHRAAETVAEAVEGGDVRAALAVLKGLGALSGSPPVVDPADAAQLEKRAETASREAEIAGREAESSRKRREMFADFV